MTSTAGFKRLRQRIIAAILNFDVRQLLFNAFTTTRRKPFVPNGTRLSRIELLDLPNELLVEIGKYLGPTNNLANLALTSSFLAELYTPVLHRLEVARDGGGHLIMHEIVKNDARSIARIRLLVNVYGVPPNAKGRSTRALCLAAHEGSVGIFTTLLELGASPRQHRCRAAAGTGHHPLAAGHRDTTVLMCALNGYMQAHRPGSSDNNHARSQHADIVRLLLAKSDLCWWDRRSGRVTHLSVAVHAKSFAGVRLLLALGADVNRRNRAPAAQVHGPRNLDVAATPLMMARSPAMLLLLLDAGADARAQNSYGRTALDCASDLYGSTAVHLQLLSSPITVTSRYHQQLLRLTAQRLTPEFSRFDLIADRSSFWYDVHFWTGVAQRSQACLDILGDVADVDAAFDALG